MKQTVSLCMIVKNEERVLARCLDSVKGIVDEIIIVDTGSTDQTKKIAESYTGLIYEYTWQDDFSAARNFAQSKASSQWILVLDADEYVDRENLSTVIELLSNVDIKVDALDVKIYNFTGTYAEKLVIHTSSRIYRNHAGIHYYRAIHEQLRKDQGTMNYVAVSLLIYHSGYLRQELIEKGKKERNRPLLSKEMHKANNAFDYFNLGNELMSEEPEAALENYKKAFMQKADIRLSWVSWCLIQIIKCLIVLNRYQEALQVIHDAEGIYDQSPDMKCLRATVYMAQNRYSDAKKELEDLLDRQAHYSHVITTTDYLELQPHLFLGDIYRYEQDFEKAVMHYTSALNINRKDRGLLSKLLDILLKQNTVGEVYSFLQKTNWISDEKDIVLIMQIVLDLGYPAFGERLLGDIHDELMKTGFTIKLNFINGKIDEAKNMLLALPFDHANSMLNKSYFDVYDLILLQLEAQDEKMTRLFGVLLPEGDIKTFYHCMLTDNLEAKLNEFWYLMLLERSIRCGKFSAFETIWQKRNLFNASILAQIGNLLSRLGLVDAAMDSYRLAQEMRVLDETSFDTIVSYFRDKGNLDNALTFVFLAFEENKVDFRLYKQGIELLQAVGADGDKRKLLQMARKQYPDSKWLMAYK